MTSKVVKKAEPKKLITGPLALLSERFEMCAILVDDSKADFVQNVIMHVAELAAEHPEILVSADDDFEWAPSDSWMSKYQPYVVKDGTLQIPVKGVLINNLDVSVGDYATGYNYIQAAWDRGMKDESVQRIALMVNTPGGQAAGNFELVDHMIETQTKPTMTMVTGNAYSGGYSIATVGDEIVAVPSAGVGSIGVVTSHVDLSKAMEQEGVKVTFIFAGKHKVDGNPYEPLPNAVKDRIQSSVDETYGVFCSTVAKNRGMEVADVKATEADTFTATEGVENGLVDRVASTKTAVTAFAKGTAASVEKVEPMTDVKQADHDKAVTDSKSVGIAEGQKAAQTRIRDILGCDEAKDKQKLANELAFADEQLSVATCKNILKAAASEKVEAPAAGAGQEASNQAAFDKAMGNGTGVKNPAGKGDEGETVVKGPDEQAKSIMGDYLAAGGGAGPNMRIDYDRYEGRKAS